MTKKMTYILRKSLPALIAALNPLLEVNGHKSQTIDEVHFRLPSQHIFCLCNVRLALLGVVRSQGSICDFESRFDGLLDDIGQFTDSKLVWISNINRAVNIFGVHEFDQAIDLVRDVAEGPSLIAGALDGKFLATDSLADKIGDDTAVVKGHTWAIGVENACDSDIDAVLALEIVAEGLGDTLALIVARALTDGVDISPVGFNLGMDEGIAVDF